MPSELLATGLEVALHTVAYLMALWLVPVWAFVAMTALIVLSRPVAWRAAAGRGRGERLAAAALLGFARPVSRAELEENLRALGGAPFRTVLYLAGGHGLSVYYLFLVGPLLGKDVLLSHILGGVFFVILAGALARAFGLHAGLGASSEDGRAEGLDSEGGAAVVGRVAHGGHPGEFCPAQWREVMPEAARYLARAAWGLALGALVGAWGLGSSGFVPARIVGSTFGTQAVNAIFGLAASAATGMTAVANLFLGTYLWKVGLAHAGLVAFFWSAPVSPQRVLLYRRLWGAGGAGRWSAALSLAALGSGLATALAFRVAGWTIRYKLVPEQMWGG